METRLTRKPAAPIARRTLRLQKILVPLDFSEPSIAAVHYAVALAQRFGAGLHLVHVHGDKRDPDNSGAADLMSQYGEMVTFLQTSACSSSNKPVAVWPENCHLRRGQPGAEIRATATDIDADLIVIATHGRTGLKHMVLGSTAERVVQHARCPVLVARFTERNPASDVRKILVPVDFSDPSLHAIKYAALFAGSLDATLCLAHVMPPIDDNSERIAVAQRESSSRNLEMTQQAEFLCGLRTETFLLAGNPANEIRTLAEREKIDLIVASNHGQTNGRNELIGKIAEQILRHAPTSVLIVPSRGFLPREEMAA